MLQYTFENIVDGVYLHFRLDGGLFNVRRFQAKTKVTVFKVTDLLFADDAAIVTHDPVSLQRLLNKLSEACNIFGLTISTRKIQHFGSPRPSGTPLGSGNGSAIPMVSAK